MNYTKIYIVLAAIFAVAVIAPLGSRPLMSPDETRYAEIAREMIQSGDWCVPRLNGVRYFEKPVLGYWLFAGSMKLFGENSFALRIVPALMALLSAFLAGLLAKKFTDNTNTPGVAAAVYLTMPIVFIIATIGILDGIFSFFVTLSVAAFYFALEAEKRMTRYSWLILCGAGVGLAFLTKGFLAYALPVCVFLPYMLWMKKWRAMFTMPWIPLIVSIVVIAPWAVLVHRAESDYWNYFVIIEHWKRFTGGEEAQHAEKPWYFIPVLIVGAAQYVFLLPAVLRGLRNTAFTPFIKFLLCWAGGMFLFFSASSGKLPTYILPCFVPIAVLVSVGLVKYMGISVGRHTVNRMAALVSGVGIVALVILAAMHCPGANGLFLFGSQPLFRSGEMWKLLILISCGLLIVSAFVGCYFEKDSLRKIYLFAAAAVPAIFASHFVIPQLVLEKKAPSEFIAEKAAEHGLDPSKTLIVTYNDFQTVCWTFERTGIYMLRPDEIRYGLQYPEHKYLSVKIYDVAELIRSKPEGGLLLIVSPDRFKERFKQKLDFAPEWSESTPSEDGIMMIKY